MRRTSELPEHLDAQVCHPDSAIWWFHPDLSDVDSRPTVHIRTPHRHSPLITATFRTSTSEEAPRTQGYDYPLGATSRRRRWQAGGLWVTVRSCDLDSTGTPWQATNGCLPIPGLCTH